MRPKGGSRSASGDALVLYACTDPHCRYRAGTPGRSPVPRRQFRLPAGPFPRNGALEFLWLLAEDAAVVELADYWLDALPARFRPGPPGRGLPQSMVLSPFLCNLYLHRALVGAKLEQQVLWLEAHGLDAGTVRRFLPEAAAAPGIPELMGVEGAAAARYFSLWGGLWQSPWEFRGRNRRPPRDPVNALLSLSYMLALNRVGQMAALRGLDPALGFLHAPLNGRPALALDLLEPVRPWVDQWVWRLLEAGALRPEDFTLNPGEGCRLGKEGRAVFFREWHTGEDQWLPRPARHALALVLARLRPLRRAAEAEAEF